MKKVLSIFGTRPEAIKMAPVVLALERSQKLASSVCVTAQHREMLDQVLDLFHIKPKYDLNLMRTGQDLTDLTSRILLELREVFKKEKPDLILVHGDTTTSFAASLAAFYAGVPVGHVEAGLRTNNLKSPFPEEANRQLTGRLASLHFAPTKTAEQNLIRETIPEELIQVTGNTVIDALFLVKDKLGEKRHSNKELFGEKLGTIADSELQILLVTGHRRENFGAGFLNICKAIKKLSNDNPSLQVVYPVHLNPNVQGPVYQILADISNVHLISPLDYLPFVALLDRSTLVLTDSGGIQEEAPSFGKPVLVMRDTTERPEAVASGTVKLVGTSMEEIVKWVQRLLNEPELYQSMAKAHNPYGDGQAAQRILAKLEKI